MSKSCGAPPEEAWSRSRKALGKDKVIVVQDALGGQPIHRWWKQWKDPKAKSRSDGDFYDRDGKVKPSGTKSSVSFVWMQGDGMPRWGG